MTVIAQKCPVCDGTGVVSRPPGIAADQPSFATTSAGPWPCPTCQGARIIYVKQGAAP